MGYLKGQKEYKGFTEGKPLSPKKAILAQCYVCNGMNEGGEDCKGLSCPLYQYMPYRKSHKKGVKVRVKFPIQTPQNMRPRVAESTEER